jgi:hypothetical protein
MRRLKHSVIVVLVLISALAAIVSPAFATPNLTASSGNGEQRPHSTDAIAPFITPSTNTRSLYTGFSSTLTIGITAVNLTISCTTATISGYVSITHTQLRITSMSFGDRGGSCVATPAGTVDDHPIICTTSSEHPWYLHIKAVDAARRSASGTMNITGGDTGVSGCYFRHTINTGNSSLISIEPNQSCRPTVTGGATTYTWTGITGSLTLNCSAIATVRFFLNAVAAPTSIRGTYTLRPDTSRDGVLTVTPAS